MLIHPPPAVGIPHSTTHPISKYSPTTSLPSIEQRKWLANLLSTQSGPSWPTRYVKSTLWLTISSPSLTRISKNQVTMILPSPRAYHKTRTRTTWFIYVDVDDCTNTISIRTATLSASPQSVAVLRWQIPSAQMEVYPPAIPESATSLISAMVSSVSKTNPSKHNGLCPRLRNPITWINWPLVLRLSAPLVDGWQVKMQWCASLLLVKRRPVRLLNSGVSGPGVAAYQWPTCNL